MYSDSDENECTRKMCQALSLAVLSWIKLLRTISSGFYKRKPLGRLVWEIYTSFTKMFQKDMRRERALT